MVDSVSEPIVPEKFLGYKSGAKGGWDFRISDLVKNLDGTDI